MLTLRWVWCITGLNVNLKFVNHFVGFGAQWILERELNVVNLVLVLQHNGLGTWSQTSLTISAFLDRIGF